MVMKILCLVFVLIGCVAALQKCPTCDMVDTAGRNSCTSVLRDPTRWRTCHGRQRCLVMEGSTTAVYLTRTYGEPTYRMIVVIGCYEPPIKKKLSWYVPSHEIGRQLASVPAYCRRIYLWAENVMHWELGQPEFQVDCSVDYYHEHVQCPSCSFALLSGEGVDYTAWNTCQGDAVRHFTCARRGDTCKYMEFRGHMGDDNWPVRVTTVGCGEEMGRCSVAESDLEEAVEGLNVDSCRVGELSDILGLK